jgi:Ribosomal L38e protein family
MPIELKSKTELAKLLDEATEVRVVRSGDDAKVKLRTEKALYTFKTTGADADSIVKGLKLPVTEY